MKVKDAIITARKFLIENNVDPREARLLLAYSMGISSDDLVKYDECGEREYKLFLNTMHRRVAGEPFAYITENKEFMKLKFKVNKYTLIPRDDTEILVQKAIEILSNMKEIKHDILENKKDKIRVLDMCTGSGCIAISIAKYICGIIVDAVDISKEAIQVASENAYVNNVKVNFIKSDLFENVNNKYKMIISNPPYIISKEIDDLQQEVKNEPRLALDGGEDGLDFYRKISKSAKDYLEDRGILMFEIGYNQAYDVSHILKNEGYVDIEILKDYGGNDRVVYAYM